VHGKTRRAPREILTLRNILHRSYDEIATALGINVGTVKSRIARARENLRAKLAEACPEFAPESAPSELVRNRAAQRPAGAGLRVIFNPASSSG